MLTDRFVIKENNKKEKNHKRSEKKRKRRKIIARNVEVIKQLFD